MCKYGSSSAPRCWYNTAAFTLVTTTNSSNLMRNVRNINALKAFSSNHETENTETVTFHSNGIHLMRTFEGRWVWLLLNQVKTDTSPDNQSFSLWIWYVQRFRVEPGCSVVTGQKHKHVLTRLEPRDPSHHAFLWWCGLRRLRALSARSTIQLVPQLLQVLQNVRQNSRSGNRGGCEGSKSWREGDAKWGGVGGRKNWPQSNPTEPHLSAAMTEVFLIPNYNFKICRMDAGYRRENASTPSGGCVASFFWGGTRQKTCSRKTLWYFSPGQKAEAPHSPSHPWDRARNQEWKMFFYRLNTNPPE